MHWSASAIGILKSLLGVGCEAYIPFGQQAMGVSRAAGGHVLLSWVSCRGEYLERVRLLHVVGDDPAVGDERTIYGTEFDPNVGSYKPDPKFVAGFVASSSYLSYLDHP